MPGVIDAQGRLKVTSTQPDTNYDVGLCLGRLTLTSGSPVVIADETAQTTVYFTPYKGNRVSVYNGTDTWDVYEFTEKSVAVPATTVTPFDVFGYISGGVLALQTVNWTNDTTRATALTTQDGIYVKSGATDYRYLGTSRTTGVSGQTENSLTKRFLWNYYNRKAQYGEVTDDTSHTYTTTTWRSWNNDATIRTEFIIGVAETHMKVVMNAEVNFGSGDSTTNYVGVGYDRTTGTDMWYAINFRFVGQLSFATTHKIMAPAAGYHYLQVVQLGGSPSVDYVRTHLVQELEG